MSRQLQIKPLGAHHIKEIVSIHLSTLEIGLLSKLGGEYLTKVFYPTVLQSSYADAYVLTDKNEGNVLAFVVYLKCESIFRCFSWKRKIITFFYIIKYVSIFPRIILDLAVIFREKSNPLYAINGIEIFIFAVKNGHQSKGLGNYLLTQTINLYKNVFLKIRVKTHTYKATQFYLRNSFQCISEGVNRGRYCVNILQKDI
jgi:hypothetical protein